MHFFRKNNSAEKTIFVVDDEEQLREYEEVVLADAGYVVKKFADPEDALQAFIKARPLLVLTDYWMPRMSGMDLIRECRRLNPEQKVALISGTVDEEVFAGSVVQPDRFLAKPFTPNQLINLTHDLIGNAKT